MCNFIHSFRLVIGDGTVLDVSRESDEDLFLSAVQGVGVFGVLTEITLQTRPMFRLYRVEYFERHFHIQFPAFQSTSHFTGTVTHQKKMTLTKTL